ncbi:MAG: 3-hydroxyacyl-CoA dehydrogenase [Pelagibacterales bacterium]|nr:3-hydroxyacyl-CoA dehydrogenase [Pelagibacterales bacterium]OUU63452.1 MAG: 3-hydroxyacyl-CoA dehydrogenase [Alphaproteobacteria bacterium TMED62]|tara:strand:+ start:3998 stop:4759 length:762 start_codon:yes stop_codon:yes gene_type:complete
MKKINAIVTGGASGLGEATVRQIIRDGGNATIFDLEEERGKILSTELGESCIYLKTDVTSEESISNSLSSTLSKFKFINLLVNCAGIGVANKVIGKEQLHDSKVFQKIINVNLIGTFNVLKLTVERMLENKPDEDGFRGVIINTASIAAFDGQIGQAAYSASKGGIVSLTLPLAREFAKYGIRVCTIAPGLFETPMLTGLPQKAYDNLIDSTLYPKRLGKPNEFANLALSIFENNMLNGEVIRLDGSLRMSPK